MVAQAPRDDVSWGPGPIWRLHAHAGARYVIFVCPEGHLTVVGENRLNHDGLVRPALSLCPRYPRECRFRDDVRLLGWPPEPP